MSDSTVAQSASKRQKPDKPYPEFPLYSHGNGKWAKKICGKTVFFGRWDDWQGALEKYQHDMPYLLRRVTPPSMEPQALSLRDLCNYYLSHQKSKVDTGELSKRSWDDLKKMADIMVAHFGKNVAVDSLRPQDFERFRSELAEGRSVVTLTNLVTRANCFFNYAEKSGLVLKVNRGLSFRKPSKHVLKKDKQSKAERIFTVEELTKIFANASKTMRCFILLSLNGGMGNGDIGQLEHRHIKGNWIVYPRPKTGVERRFPLWPETFEAIERCKSTNAESPLVFVTKCGGQWAKETADNPISKEFSKILKSLDSDAAEHAAENDLPPPTHKYHQAGRGFYSLRHTFRTIADGCRDQVAVNFAMGHSDDSMAANYRHGIEDERLQAVVDHVRKWAMPIIGVVQ